MTANEAPFVSAGSDVPVRAILSPDVLHQTVEGRVVLLDLRGEQYYSLDDVGTRIWQLLAEHDDLEDVFKRMLEIYRVDESTLRVDLAAFLTKLADARLVTLNPASDPP